MTQGRTVANRGVCGAHAWFGSAMRNVRRVIQAAGAWSICVLLASCSNPSDQALSRAGLNPGRLRGVVAPGVDLSGLNLVGRDFSGADLHGADLGGCDLRRPDLTKANLRGANLSSLPASKLRRALYPEERRSLYYQTNLSDANLSEADLTGANLRNARLVKSNLRFAKLRGALFDLIRLEEVILMPTLFYDCNLEGADLRDVKSAHVFKSKLNGADLRGSLWTSGPFTDSDLRGARLEGADLARAIYLATAQLQGAVYDSETRLPSDVDPKQAGMIRAVRAAGPGAEKPRKR